VCVCEERERERERTMKEELECVAPDRVRVNCLYLLLRPGLRMVIRGGFVEHLSQT
jgi:hypothetical protein